MPAMKKENSKPFIAIDSPGALIGLIIAIIFAFFAIKAFVDASHDPSAYTSPDCSNGTESCN